MEKVGICCFTGHRSIAPEYMIKLPALIGETLDTLVCRGVRVFRAGGAVGFDTLCALKVLEKKKTSPEIKLELCLPCRDQTRGWNESYRKIYDYILERADSVRYAHIKYTPTCMHDRNRMLVDGSDFCVAFCTSSSGGTAYTCSYALKCGTELINLYDRFGMTAGR